jgi:hypothetical protein
MVSCKLAVRAVIVFFVFCCSCSSLVAQDTAKKGVLSFRIQKNLNTDTLHGLTFQFACNNQDSTFMKIFVSDNYDDSSYVFWGNMIRPHMVDVSSDRDVLVRVFRTLNKKFVTDITGCCPNCPVTSCGYFISRREDGKVTYATSIDMQFVTRDFCGTETLNSLANLIKELCQKYIREGY